MAEPDTQLWFCYQFLAIGPYSGQTWNVWDLRHRGKENKVVMSLWNLNWEVLPPPQIWMKTRHWESDLDSSHPNQS